jgi:hypothetical protein
MGRGAETEAHINEAFRLSPRDILAVYYPLAHFWLANALALLGSLDQARAAANAGGFGAPVAYRPDDHKVITPLLQPNIADALLSNLGVKGQAALTRNLR